MSSYYTLPINPPNAQKNAINYGAGLLNHQSILRQFGPPPPNYKIERHRRHGKGGGIQIRYQETTLTDAEWTWTHPFSVQGSIIQDEPSLARKKSVGLNDAPFKYRAGELNWNYENTAMKALAAGLVQFFDSRNKIGGLLTERDCQDLYDNAVSDSSKTNTINNQLYYPADRDSLVWPEEAKLAIVARCFGIGLIILSPYVRHDGLGVDRIYDIEGRPPVYARWSTGRQGSKKSLILGCLPEQTVASDRSIRPMWFTVKPADVNNTPEWWDDMYGTYVLPHVGVYKRNDRGHGKKTSHIPRGHRNT